MVDLRGIEEIARLHLLHNVQGRKPSPDDGGQPQGPGPDGGIPANGGGQPGYDGGQMPYNGGGGQPGYDGSGQPVYDGSQTPYDGSQPGYDAGQIAAYGGNMPAQGEPAFPLFPGQAPQQAISYPVPSSVNTGSILNAGNVAASVSSTPVASAAAQAARTCGTCGKSAGKGKFCIECGAFVGPAVAAAATAVGAQQVVTGSVLERDGGAIINTAPPAEPAPPQFPTFVTPAAVAEPQPALRKASLFESPQQIAETGSAYGAPTATQPGILQGSKRQPVTSFSLDPSRIGLPGQQPAGKGAGVEF
jgi:hypothetical protein